MDFFAEILDEEKASAAVKRSVPIGIFGSFAPRNREILELIRDRLLADGYDARISLDLGGESPREDDEDIDIYNLRISHRLLDASIICIFVVFLEEDGEHNINQSVSMEFERFCARHRTSDAMVMEEKGAHDQAGGIFRGRRAQTCTAISWEIFIRTPENRLVDTEEAITMIRQFCLQRILRRAERFPGEDR